MSESDMRGTVVNELRTLHAIAVENPVLPGTPDVNYAEGWIELKWLRRWPTRPETVVHVEHFSPQQRVWHIQRRLVGGRSWVLIQCKREWLLFDGAIAALNLCLVPKAELICLAEKYWGRGLKKEELIKCISQDLSDFCLTEDVKAKLKSLLQNVTVYPSTGT